MANGPIEALEELEHLRQNSVLPQLQKSIVEAVTTTDELVEGVKKASALTKQLAVEPEQSQ